MNKPIAPGDWLTRGRLRLRQLLLLRSLGEERNLRRAAARLNLAQPAATRLVRELEAFIGVALFERSSKGMSPTVYGEVMIRHANVVLADLDAARKEVDALAGGASGRIDVGTVNSIAPLLLPQALAQVKAERPGLDVTVHEGTHEPMIGLLARGELDLVLARAMPGGTLPGLQYELLYREQFRIVSGPKHRLARAKNLTLADLIDEAWILPPETVPLRQQLDLLFVSVTGRTPQNPIESVSILTNQTLMQEAPLLCTLSVAAAERYASQRLVAILPVPLKGLLGPVALVTREASQPSPAVDALIAAIRKAAETLKR
jgi:DNA-binding transcriptional LysR family regulator